MNCGPAKHGFCVRRRLLRGLALALVTALASCSCPNSRQVAADSPAAISPPGTAGEPRVEFITVTSQSLGAQPVVVMLPRGYDARRRRPFPMLLAFSGRGEAVLAPERGAWGWVRDYHLQRQARALTRGKLVATDLQGLVSPSWLQRYNRSLGAAPYAGMVVVCPHTYDLLGQRTLGHAAYERFYLRELPAAVRRRYNVRTDPGGLGLDGVSLGGLWALYLGLGHPGEVGQVGALQPAVTPFLTQLRGLARRNRVELAKLPISLVTSTGDGLRPAVSRMSAMLRQVKVEHQLTLLRGPHDYIFNQGPGGIHMLLWHDRRFQGLTLR